MYRMQYHFETDDDAVLEEMADAAVTAARLAHQKGLRPATVWISHDEKPQRLVVEFTGKDRWECDAQQQQGKDDPEIGAILARAFHRRLTSVETYEEVER